MVNTFLHYGLFYISIYQLPGALVAIIIGSSPLITALFGIVLIRSERVGVAKLMPIVLGVIGIAFISFSNGVISADGLNLVYVLVLIGAVSCGVTGSFIVAKFSEKEKIDPIVLTSLQIFLGGVMLFAVSLFAEGGPELGGTTWRFYSALSWLSFLSAAGFGIWFTILRRPGIVVTDINRWKFIIPLFGAVLSWVLVDGESPTLQSLIGMAIVLISVIWYEIVISHRNT